MRFMSIPPFGREIEILDFDFFIRSRLNQEIVLWPEQAMPLVGYMGWPNDPEDRTASVSVVRRWAEGSRGIPRRLCQIQADWARVADVFNLHLDLTEGGHQQRRGGERDHHRLRGFGEPSRAHGLPSPSPQRA
jgi:hypothetical protein